MNIRLIACIDENHGIGFRNKLLYPLKGDMKRFASLTKGNAVVMGRKTFESLPGGPLKDRDNIIISSSMKPSKGLIIYRTVEDFLIGGRHHPAVKDKTVYVIGGGEIYREMIKHAAFLDITIVSGAKIADAFFPEIDPSIWTVESKEEDIKEGAVSYRYVTYKRINPL